MDRLIRAVSSQPPDIFKPFPIALAPNKCLNAWFSVKGVIFVFDLLAAVVGIEPGTAGLESQKLLPLCYAVHLWPADISIFLNETLIFLFYLKHVFCILI